ncbi:hypothetical protein EA770_02325 [Acinetobacter baumannii]|nr:hypothetical protein EA770_02325 [Acinetobacter baumannii]
MINIVLEVHWSNNPMPVNELIENPQFIFDLPLGLFTSLELQVKSVNGKKGHVELNALDVEADPAGTAQEVKEHLEDLLAQVNQSKLDKADYIQHFRGLFSSYAALTNALPAAIDGDYAHVDGGANFGRMAAIWDGDDHKWIIHEVHVALNTDEMPEGQENLYFKVNRAQQAALNAQLVGLDTSLAAEITAQDSILSSQGKLQAQIKKLNAVWVDITTVATVHPSITGVNVQLARINGLLYIKGYFNISTVSSVPIDAFTITNPLYKSHIIIGASGFNVRRINYIKAMFSDGLSIDMSFNATGNSRNEAEAQTSVQTIVLGANASNRFNPVSIPPVAIGELVIK